MKKGGKKKQQSQGKFIKNENITEYFKGHCEWKEPRHSQERKKNFFAVKKGNSCC